MIHQLKKLIHKAVEPIKASAGRQGAHSRFAAMLYYFIFDASFGRECRAVLRGRYEYQRRRKSSTASLFLLRRNIHRIEKGLIMRPRRARFATDYIVETVKALQSISRERAGACRDDIAWAEDVLEDYFSATDEQAQISQARLLFKQISRNNIGQDRRVPFTRDLTVKKVSYDDLYALSRRRRSVRWFKQEPIERALIDQACLIAQQAPSACNRQPYRFLIFDDPKQAQEIGAIPMGTAGFAGNFPAIVVIVGDLSAYASERDRHAIYTDASLAIMGFVMALETLDLASCCINWPDIERLERVMQNRLGIRPFERPVMLVAFGYPDETGMVPFSQKAPLSEMRVYA